MGLIRNMCLFFVTQYNSSLSSFVPNFRILTQVVAEKSLTEKKCPYVLYKSERRKKCKIEKRRQNEDQHFNFHLHSKLCLPEGVHKILKHWLQK